MIENVRKEERTIKINIIKIEIHIQEIWKDREEPRKKGKRIIKNKDERRKIRTFVILTHPFSTFLPCSNP
jgi:hypothetical protein